MKIFELELRGIALKKIEKINQLRQRTKAQNIEQIGKQNSFDHVRHFRDGETVLKPVCLKLKLYRLLKLIF